MRGLCVRYWDSFRSECKRKLNNRRGKPPAFSSSGGQRQTFLLNLIGICAQEGGHGGSWLLCRWSVLVRQRMLWFVSGGLARSITQNPTFFALVSFGLLRFGWLADCFWLPSTSLFRWLQNVKSGEK